jgi:hypothetical protein
MTEAAKDLESGSDRAARAQRSGLKAHDGPQDEAR